MSKTMISFRNSGSRMLPTLCASLVLAPFTPLARHADAQMTGKARTQETTKKPSTPQEVWTATSPSYLALRESKDAMTARIATLDEFFAERKQGTRPFAEAVLGLEGKARRRRPSAKGRWAAWPSCLAKNAVRPDPTVSPSMSGTAFASRCLIRAGQDQGRRGHQRVSRRRRRHRGAAPGRTEG